MSTAQMTEDIKLGSRVVYVANDGREYNAIAKSTPKIGYNQGLKLYSAYLNLAYLNDLAETVDVAAAPLLGTEADDKHLSDAAYQSAKRDVRYQTGSGDDKEDVYDEHLDRLKANPRTIGWRPGSVGDAPKSYTQAKGDYSQPGDPYGIAAEYTGQSAAVDVRGNSVPGVRALPTQDEADAIVAAAALETKTYADGTTATGTGPLPDQSPAEQDLAEANARSAAADTPSAVEEIEAGGDGFGEEPSTPETVN